MSEICNWLDGEDFTHTLKNFGLGMLNLWSSYYFERCYLEDFFVLHEDKVPEAIYHFLS